jgi:hypothetical protein
MSTCHNTNVYIGGKNVYLYMDKSIKFDDLGYEYNLKDEWSKTKDFDVYSCKTCTIGWMHWKEGIMSRSGHSAKCRSLKYRKKESLTDSILVMQSDCGLAEVEYDKRGEAEKNVYYIF